MQEVLPRLPTCRADFQLSRYVAGADHEFAAVSIPRERSRKSSVTLRGSSPSPCLAESRGTERFLGHAEIAASPSPRRRVAGADPVERFGTAPALTGWRVQRSNHPGAAAASGRPRASAPPSRAKTVVVKTAGWIIFSLDYLAMRTVRPLHDAASTSRTDQTPPPPANRAAEAG